MTKEQKEARSLLQKEREKAGLSTDMNALIEKYRAVDPEYAARLETVIGSSAKRIREKTAHA